MIKQYNLILKSSLDENFWKIKEILKQKNPSRRLNCEGILMIFIIMQ